MHKIQQETLDLLIHIHKVGQGGREGGREKGGRERRTFVGTARKREIEFWAMEKITGDGYFFRSSNLFFFF